MLDNLKSFISKVIAVIGLIFGALWLYKRSQDNHVDQVLADNDKVNAEIKEENKVIASNDQQLTKEEQVRKDLENEAPSNVTDLTKFFNSRKPDDK